MSQPIDAVVDMLRGSGVDFAADAPALRATFEGMLSAAPLPAGVRFEPGSVAGVDVLTITAGSSGPRRIIYLHGGGYVAGTAHAYAGFTGLLCAAVGATATSVEYRRAPEAQFPAALEDADAVLTAVLTEHDAASVAVVGDSAGGGLVVAALAERARRGDAQPACAVVLSPWADLRGTNATLDSRADADPSLSAAGLRRRSEEYRGDVPAEDPRLSPVLADLRGLPPVLVQVGTAEILLDDALNLAAALARHDVDVDLQVRADMVHVFPSFAGLLPQADTAVVDIAAFITRHTQEV